MSSIAEAIDRISPSFIGQLVQPTDASYERWRRVHNRLIDERPAAIARCHGIADIVDAVRLARTLGLDVAVRTGGTTASAHEHADVASTACTLRATGFNVLDQDNFFRQNVNILPGSGGTA